MNTLISQIPQPLFQSQSVECPIELSIVMPCLNEAETLGSCIQKALHFLQRHQINGEIIIADNGSSDGSQEIARRLGAQVIDVKEKGYGAALQGGIGASRGRFIIMGDSDDSYDFSNLMPFLIQLRRGYDLVLGNRFLGGIGKGAMPFLHRYLGNPVLSNIGKIFFGSPCGDFHCGLRGFSKESIKRLNLATQGMEFASEMVVKATLHELKIAEVPTTLAPDGRSRPPHLRTWRDGWRHLKFLLLYCPRWLFLYPGLVLGSLGAIFYVAILMGPLQIGSITLDVHTLIYAASALVVGFQAVVYAIFAEATGIMRGILPPNRNNEKLLSFLTVEFCAVVGVCLVLLGLGLGLLSIHTWQQLNFGSLKEVSQLRYVITSCLLLTLGTQTVFSGFFVNSHRL